MKKFIIKTTVFVVVVMGFIALLVLMQTPEFIVGRKKVFLHKDENRHYDLLVLGSSRAMYSFDPTVYNGPLKIFNMGEEGQGLPSNYLMMKMLLEKYNLTIDTLLLEIDEFAFAGSSQFSRQFRDDFFVTDIEDKEVYRAFRKYRGPAYAEALKIFPHSANLIYSDFFHFVKNQAYSLKNYIPKLEKTYQAHIKEVVKYKGYKPLDPKPHHTIVFTAEKLPIEEDDRAYFYELINICRKHNVKIYFYRAPILHCNLKESSQYDKFIDSFTVANNIPYYDYKCQFQWTDSYFDQNHPTGRVSQMVTKDILSRMKIQ